MMTTSVTPQAIGVSGVLLVFLLQYAIKDTEYFPEEFEEIAETLFG